MLPTKLAEKVQRNPRCVKLRRGMLFLTPQGNNLGESSSDTSITGNIDNKDCWWGFFVDSVGLTGNTFSGRITPFSPS